MKRLSKEEFVNRLVEKKSDNEKQKYSWNTEARSKALRW